MRSLLAILAAIGLIAGGVSRAAASISGGTSAAIRGRVGHDAREMVLRGSAGAARLVMPGRVHGGHDGVAPPAIAAPVNLELPPRVLVSSTVATSTDLGGAAGHRLAQRSRAPPRAPDANL